MGRPYNDEKRVKNDIILHVDEDVSLPEEDDRIVYFSGEMSEVSTSSAISSIFTLSKRDHRKPIYLIIDTYGGYVHSMFALYDAIKFVTCPVHTIALGKVMSAGVLILAAGEKGERKIAPHARVMSHPSWTYVEGNIFQIQNSLNELKEQEALWIDAMIAETGKDRKTIEMLSSVKSDTYLSAKQCIEYGIADDFLYQMPGKQK